LASHITILYDIYLPGGGDQAVWTGGWGHYMLKWPAWCAVCN